MKIFNFLRWEVKVSEIGFSFLLFLLDHLSFVPFYISMMRKPKNNIYYRACHIFVRVFNTFISFSSLEGLRLIYPLQLLMFPKRVDSKEIWHSKIKYVEVRNKYGFAWIKITCASQSQTFNQKHNENLFLFFSRIGKVSCTFSRHLGNKKVCFCVASSVFAF